MIIDFHQYFQKFKTGPLWLRVSKMVEYLIENGLLKHGDILPAERQLAEMLLISRVSVRRAIIDLSSKGLVYRRHGSGTYIRSSQFSAQKRLPKLEGFTEDLLSRNLQPKTVILQNEVRKALIEEQNRLSLKADEDVLSLRRLRFSEGKAVAIEYAIVPLKFLPSPYFEGPSLYQEFEKINLRPIRATQQLKATLLDADQAQLLDVKPASPALLIIRQSFCEKGEIIEYTQSWFRADMHDYIVSITMDTHEDLS